MEEQKKREQESQSLVSLQCQLARKHSSSSSKSRRRRRKNTAAAAEKEFLRCDCEKWILGRHKTNNDADGQRTTQGKRRRRNGNALHFGLVDFFSCTCYLKTPKKNWKIAGSVLSMLVLVLVVVFSDGRTLPCHCTVPPPCGASFKLLFSYLCSTI